jgi:DNA-binding MltR family transcriptional regulator
MNQKNTADLMEESDRGSVLVGAAILEDELSDLIRSTSKKNGLTTKSIEDLFSMNGPASTFSSKTLICYAFGLISKEVYDDLNRIRKIRNKFAHTSDKVDFLMPEIEDLVAEIKCCVEVSKNFEGEMFKGRSKIVGPFAPVPSEWEMRSRGFVKYTKSIFCLGILQLQQRILEHKLNSFKK